ncbi:MAG: UDP-N-acetylmuramate--L-alanine ligase [Actinomycetes bacterium]
MIMPTTLEQLRGKRVHFIGIGGAGMSGIAKIMLSQGIEVSGSDVKDSTVTENLRTMGATIVIGHKAENVAGVDLLVLSTAIAANNPERAAALDLGIPTMARAQALALLMNGKRSVAVAGTHGKTTTTSMLTVALQRAGLDPSFAIGGMINASGVNAYFGSGDIFVAEADESDGSFLAYKPLGAIITNIELDHVDHFADLESIYGLFEEFIGSIAPNGFLVACGDDPGVRELLKRIKAQGRDDLTITTYGEGENDWQIARIALEAQSSVARVLHNGKVIGELELQVPGHHNLLNALAALAASDALDNPARSILDGLATFTGSRRRFELKGEVGGVRVVDDYGHHPTEIRVTLETARRYVGTGRLIVIFQPHRYSRTQAFAAGFAQALDLADEVYLLEVYAATEEPIPGVSSLLISSQMQSSKVHYEPSMVAVVEAVTESAKENDLIMTMGAGDVSSLAPVILKSLAQ